MNRRIFFQAATPALLIGLILLGACLASLWSINRLQANMASILTETVAGLEVASEMQIKLRQLRTHTILYAMDPKNSKRRQRVDDDRREFEVAFQASTKTASPAKRPLLEKIDA